MAVKIIMVASGKGGTGKSTVSVFLGSAFAESGKRVLLVELDSGLRSIDIIAGVCGKTIYDIQDVLSGNCDPNKAIVQSSLYQNLWLISAPYEGGCITEDALRVFCDKMRTHFDIIILDTAAGLGAPLQSAQKVCTQALLVITPDPVTIRDGRIVTDYLFNNGTKDLRLIINKVKTEKHNKNAVKNLDECIDTVCAQLIGVIPESLELQVAAANGERLGSNCQVNKIFQNISTRINGGDIPLEIY